MGKRRDGGAWAGSHGGGGSQPDLRQIRLPPQPGLSPAVLLLGGNVDTDPLPSRRKDPLSRAIG